ncbi:MAG: TetR/AcrR family transcriptional regulator [Sphingobium phenoxybenzoativorans]
MTSQTTATALTESASPFRSKAERAHDRGQKREGVLRAAVRMFNARGFHATSLDDVAASLHISKPTIYYYLGNKDQVLLECVTRGLGELAEAAERVRETPGTGLERLRAFLFLYAKVNMDDFGRCVVRTGDECLVPKNAERFRMLKRRIDGAMRALIEEGMADGSIAPGDVKLIAFTLAGALNWPARWHDPAGPETPDQIAEKMVGILTAGLAPRPAERSA